MGFTFHAMISFLDVALFAITGFYVVKGLVKGIGRLMSHGR
jgi:hypothetical protein